jgi:RHS repeat-associated protein
MITQLFGYNRDGSLADTPEITIKYHAYHRRPIDINGTSLRYNSRGRRAGKSGRSYRGYGAEIVEAENGTETCFISSPGGLIAIYNGKTHQRIVRNRQNSVCVCGGAMVQYSPFGEYAAVGALPRRMYTGYEYDTEWSVYNARRRLYSPKVRTFFSVDPKLQFSSPYLYCMSDPFNNVDPTGEMSTGGIVNIVVTAATIIASIVVTILTAGVAAPAATEASVAESFAGADIEAAAFAGIPNAGDAAVAQAWALARADAGDIVGAAGRRTIWDAQQRGVAEGVINTAKNRGKIAYEAAMKAGKKAAGWVGGIGIAAAGPAGVAADAASGEHIGAYDAVNKALLQPAIAIASAAATFGIAAMLKPFLAPAVEAVGRVSVSKFIAYGIGGTAGGLMGGIASSAANRENFGAAKTWETIGINTGIVAVMAMGFHGVNSISKSIANRMSVKLGFAAIRMPALPVNAPPPPVSDSESLHASVFSSSDSGSGGIVSFTAAVEPLVSPEPFGAVPEVPAGLGLHGGAPAILDVPGEVTALWGY